MGKSDKKTSSSARDDFAARAAGPQRGFLFELGHFMRHNKKWWLTPIILVVLLLGLLVFLGGTGAAPFIYTIF